MNEWISWLTQHPSAKLAMVLSLIWLALGSWRWWRCRQQVTYLDFPLWLPLLLALASPLMVLKGLALGWDRFDRELVGLTSLQPWEGLRAIQIVRHATHSFFFWSTPLVSAGLICLVLTVVLTMIHSVWRFDLYLRARRKGPNELQEIRQELRVLRQLLESLQDQGGAPASPLDPPGLQEVRS